MCLPDSFKWAFRSWNSAVALHCQNSVVWSRAATKYGQHYDYVDVNGEVAPTGGILAKFIGVFHEAELAELHQMQAEEDEVHFAKAA